MTEIHIRDLDPRDEPKAIEFAIEGMHLHWFVKNPRFERAYGRYFWDLERAQATDILAAYADDGRFLGVILASIKGEPALPYPWWRKAYVKAVDLFNSLRPGGHREDYDAANEDMLVSYLAENTVDGEIGFLVADPNSGVKGVGTALLEAFEERHPGKDIYLYTDDGCTYQFYDSRGFERVG
ncbi:GNAT family N-acetyltransferase, partial [uncultured Corynebacterium sp.]